MHDYLIINLTAEYLSQMGALIKKISPQGTLLINVSKALFSFNEKTRTIYKTRDEIEFEQLIRLNSLPNIDLAHLKQVAHQSTTKANNELNYLDRKMKKIQEKITFQTSRKVG